MGWWSLGPEDTEDAVSSIESPPPLPIRRARGGAGRVPDRKNTGPVSPADRRKTRSRSPRKSKRTKSPKKKRARVVGGPLEKEEEELNLFASIGRMMTNNNNPRYASSDLSTLGTAKYPGQDGIPVQAFNNTNEAQRRANEMANAMAWLTNPTATAAQESSASTSRTADFENWWESESASTSSTLELLKAEEMPDLMALLKHGRTSSHHDNSVMPTTVLDDEPNRYTELSAEEKKALELQRSIEWLQNNHAKYVHEDDDLEYNEEPFQKVDDGFGQWKLNKTPSLDWENYDPMENHKQTQRLAKDLKQSLDLFLTDAFDVDDSSYDRIAMKQLKDLFADWKLLEDDGAKELEEALSWWKLHASNYNPATATDEETGKFLESKRLLGLLGWKEDDVSNERIKEMEETLELWENYKDKSSQDLDDVSIEKMKKFDGVLIQIKRDGLDENEMKYMAKEMDKILTGYIEKGHKITDLSKMEKSYQSDFEKAQSLLSLCVKRVETLPDQRIEDIVEMLKSLEQNKHASEILEKYDDLQMTDKFRKLQEAMMNWETNGHVDSHGATQAATDEAVYSTFECVLDWWVANGENFDFQTASEEEVIKAQFAESILDVWIPSDSGNSPNFYYSCLAAEEIKDGLALYRAMEEPQQFPYLTTEIEMKRRRTGPPALSWMRKKTSHDTTDNLESLHVENPKPAFNGVAQMGISEEEKRAQEMSTALDWLRNNDTEIDVDDDMSVALSIATFKKIDVLMPKTGDSAVPTTMTGALEWLRSRTTVDDDTVSSFKKIDNVLTKSGVSATISEGGFAGALEWLRKRHARKAASDSDVESTNNDSHIDHAEIFSNRKSDVEKRAGQMTSALDWLRSGDVGEDVSVGSGIESLDIGSSVGNILGVDRSDYRSFALEDACDGGHIRSATKTTEQSSNVTYGAVCGDVAGCSLSADSEHKSADETVGDDNCFRHGKATSHSTTYEPNDNSELNAFGAFASVSLRSKAGHIADSVGSEQSWRRNVPQNGGPDDTDMTLIGTQCVKPVSSEENIVLQTDDELDWSRSNARADSTTKTSQTSPKIIPCGRDPKQRSKDLEKIVQWMRKGQGRGQKREDKYDPTGAFRRLHLLLPHRPGQDKAARARMIEGALDSCRMRNSHHMDRDIKSGGVFKKLDMMSISNKPFEASTDGAPEEMQLDWMRLVDSSVEVPTETGEDTVSFSRPCDVNCIPRPHSPTGVHDDDLAWRMHVNRMIPGVPNEKVQCQDHDLLNFIPHVPEGGQAFQNDHLNWVRHPWVEALSDDEILCFNHPRNFESIPREGLPATDENIEGPLNWMRCNDVPLSKMNELPFETASLMSVLPNRGNKNSPIVDSNLHWMRHPGSPADTDEETIAFNRPGDVNSIPRDGLQRETDDPDMNWARNENESVSRVSEEDYPFNKPGMLNFIPTSREKGEGPDDDNVDWIRQPGVGPRLDEEKIAGDGPGESEEGPETEWTRHPNKGIPGVADDVFPFERPGPLDSARTPCDSDDQGTENDLGWTRNPSEIVPSVPDEDMLFTTKPGGVRSIPRYGEEKPEGDSEFMWARDVSKSENKPSVPDEDMRFTTKPGDVRSIPRFGEEKPEDDSEFMLAREVSGSENKPSVPDENIRFTKRGDVRSIPRYGEEKPEGDSEFMWTRDVSKSENKPSFPEEDMRFTTKPGDVRSIPRYGEEKPEDDSEFMCAREVSGSENTPSLPNENIRFTKRGDVRSIPRHGEEKPEEALKFMQTRRAPEDEYEKVEPLERAPLSNTVSRSKRPEEDDVEDEFLWSRSVFPDVTPAEEEDVLDYPKELRSIPRTGEPKTSEDPKVGWVRSGGKFIPGVPEDDDVFIRPVVSYIPHIGVPPDGETKNVGQWSCHPSTRSYNSAPGEGNVFDRPGDICSIPRAGKPHEEAYPNLGWNRNPAWKNQRAPNRNSVPGEDHVFDRPGGIRSIPRAGKPHEEAYPNLGWNRNPAWKNQRAVPGEDHVFDRPGDIRSIPRAGKPHEEAYPKLDWNRNPAWKKQGVPDDENVYDRPGDIRSIPRTFRPRDKDYPEIFWDRNTVFMPEEQLGEKNVFDRPGNLRSIPRDGRPCNEDYPELTWGRNLVRKQQRSPEEMEIFDRAGDIRSIPRDGRPKDSDDPDFEWERQPSFNSVPTGSEENNVYDYPGDLSSIPRDGLPNETGEHTVNWRRHFSSKSISIIPLDSRATPRDGMHPGEEQEYEEKPEYDWSGGRPRQLRAIAPYVDWSSDKPEDAEYDWMVSKSNGQLARKKEPSYDWSGAEPFERPTENTLVTLPVTSLGDDEVSSYRTVPDTITMFTELREDKPKAVTGVPCAAWTMLALGAAAGGAMGSTTAGEGGAVASSFATNNGVGTSTDMVYPDPGSLPNCAADANCQIVMDGLSPVLPPDVLGLFDFPGTCQTKARDWLRTGKDILEFKAERIRQRYAMSVFFCEMEGGDWIEGDSWLSDLHECDWYNRVGLDPCNRHEQMEMLRVTDNGLAGTLPVEMFILSNLYEFTLANNLISGSLPQLFDKFKELDTLVIPFNQFGGSLPHQIWEYPDMVYLDVAYNGFSGTIPADIDTRMPNLEVAYLENNKLSGPIPETMGNLQKLHKLHLDDNKFTGKIPSTLGQPPRLCELLLHDNLLTGQVPKELGDLNRLQLLTLHYNSLDEQIMDEHICNLVYNEQLELATVDKAIIGCGCCSPGEESFV